MTAALKIEALEAGYVRDLPILRRVDLGVERASLTVIIGPNGAGKSTLIKAVAGLVPVSGGRVLLDGKDITGIRPDQMAGLGLSYVPQTDNIFRHLSIRENLALVLRRVAERQARLEELFALFPVLAQKQADRAASLSGGQRQMLAVAMALAPRPRVMLMDEPSAGLSPKIAAEVLAARPFADPPRRDGASGRAERATGAQHRRPLLHPGRGTQPDGRAGRRDPGGSGGGRDLSRRPTGGRGMIQNLLDGILTGAVISLGAIGLTMVMHMLRFANFAYAELLAIGAYAALVFDRVLAALAPALATAFKPTTVSASLALATLLAMAITGASAVVVDWLVFRRIRAKADALSMVFASFGVALIIRNAITLAFGHNAQLFSPDIAFATVLSTDPLILIKADQVFVLVAALALMAIFHIVLTRTAFGFALRAVAENPALAQVAGVRLSTMIVAVWLIGGGLSAAAGVFYTLTNHLSPALGHNFLLPVFAATIVGGIGSVYGAVLGGFLVGVASSLSLALLPSGYVPAMPFLIILAVLLLRPHGLFGEDQA